MWPHLTKLKCSLNLKAEKNEARFEECLLIIYLSLSFSLFYRTINTRNSLNSTEARAIISGQSDLYVKMGSKVILTCVISQGPHDLGTIAWHRGEFKKVQMLLFVESKWCCWPHTCAFFPLNDWWSTNKNGTKKFFPGTFPENWNWFCQSWLYFLF